MRTCSLIPLAALVCSLVACSAWERRAEGAGQEDAGGQVKKAPLSYAQRRGRILYMHYCAVCHGERGAGDGFNAWNLSPRPRDLGDPEYQHSVSDAWLVEVIAQGGRGVNKSNLMPAWGNTLDKEQIAVLVAFIRTLENEPAEVVE